MCELHTDFLEPANGLKGIQLFVFFNKDLTREHPHVCRCQVLWGPAGHAAFSPAAEHACSPFSERGAALLLQMDGSSD